MNGDLKHRFAEPKKEDLICLVIQKVGEAIKSQIRILKQATRWQKRKHKNIKL
jgi:hypothetical protein